MGVSPAAGLAVHLDDAAAREGGEDEGRGGEEERGAGVAEQAGPAVEDRERVSGAEMEVGIEVG